MLALSGMPIKTQSEPVSGRHQFSCRPLPERRPARVIVTKPPRVRVSASMIGAPVQPLGDSCAPSAILERHPVASDFLAGHSSCHLIKFCLGQSVSPSIFYRASLISIIRKICPDCQSIATSAATLLE